MTKENSLFGDISVDNYFKQQILDHILLPGNVFKYNWESFWEEFAFNKNIPFSGHYISEEFIENILPKIHTFEMTSEQIQAVKLFRYDIFLEEDSEGFKLIEFENQSQRMKHICRHLENKNNIQFLNDQELSSFSKRPDLLLWLSLILKKDSKVPGKILNCDEMRAAFKKYMESDELETTVNKLTDKTKYLECAESFKKDFFEFLCSQDDF